jgi:hypothetical protein
MIVNIVSNSGLTVVFEDGPKMMHKSSPEYANALEALASQDVELLRSIMDPRSALIKFSKGEIFFESDATISVAAHPIGVYCTKLLMDFKKNRLPWDSLSQFISNRSKNPSARAKTDLDQFLGTEGLPITNDGCFLALKLFTGDWIDSDTGTSIGAPGKTISFPREGIDRRLRRGVEKGFSAGGQTYIDHNANFVGKKVVVKINPMDVVCVYSSPVREVICCKYTIIKETSLSSWDLLHDGDTAESISV